MYLPAVACVAMILLICIPMMKNMTKTHGSDESDVRREIGELPEEITRLKAESVLDDKSEALDG